MSPSAARVARHRELAKDGKRVFMLRLDTVAIEQLLCREDLLVDGAEHSDRDVDAALVRFIEKLVVWPG